MNTTGAREYLWVRFLHDGQAYRGWAEVLARHDRHGIRVKPDGWKLGIWIAERNITEPPSEDPAPEKPEPFDPWKEPPEVWRAHPEGRPRQNEAFARFRKGRRVWAGFIRVIRQAEGGRALVSPEGWDQTTWIRQSEILG